MRYFTSDTHYGHENIIRFCGRPYADAHHMKVDLVIGNRWETCRDDAGVDEAGVEQRADEVLVLLAQRAELGDAEVFLVEAPAGELRLSGWCGGVGVLHLDEPVAPAVGQRTCSRSTPSILKPWVCSKGENSPATPSMRSANRAVSSLLSAMGSTSISTDIVAACGSCSSR